MKLDPGTRLGSYEILSLIGAGGMGEVYRARDHKLRREVAIKILQDLSRADQKRRARFEREARLLASLNHPHVGAIYGFVEAHDTPALVLELIEGETLADRIRRGRVPLSDALTIGRQIVEAVEAAHEKGIVHRDLKPANIKITPDGTVKVLDFGIAKAGPSDPLAPELGQLPTATASATQEGSILGTVSYMSPEQARGQTVDHRTDVWAFGCVLFEMLTGRMAFTGATATDTLAAILEREPDWRALPARTPLLVRRLLQRCLVKDPKRRLRDIGDARIEIEDAASAPHATLEPVMRSTWRRPAAAIGLALVTGVGAAIAASLLGFPRVPDHAPTTRVTGSRLTSYNGRQYAAALSPDGRSFVFVSTHRGPPDIWLRQVSGGEPVQLTNDAFDEEDLAFGADGEVVYFTRVERGQESVWQIGTLGGQPHKVVASGHSAVPSPDGRQLAYVRLEPEDQSETVILSALDGSAERAIARRVPSFPRVRPAWSPNGRFVSYVRAGLFAPANLFVVDLRSGQERQVTQFTHPLQGVGQHMWLPDNHRLVVSYTAESSRIPLAYDLAILDVDDGSLVRFTTTIADSFVAPSLSADGSRLIATSTGLLREIWKLPLKSPDPDVNGQTGTRLIDSAQDPMWSFVSRDGATLLYNSPANGTRNLWTMALDGASAPRQITSLAGNVISHSALSPDGTRVTFVSFASGTSDIWTQNVDGTNLRQLTNDPAADSWPAWSPDGRSIAFTSVRQGAQQTWIVPADGGQAQKLIDGFFRGDWISRPDGAGSWIVSSNNRDTVRLIDVEAKRIVWEERIMGSNASTPMFSRDRRSISVVAANRSPLLIGVGSRAITLVDVATRKQRVVANLPFPIVFRAAWTEDNALIVNRNDPVSSIVMFDRLLEAQR